MRKKISAVLAASMIATNVSPAINVFASEVVKEKTKIIEECVVSKAKITPFNLSKYSNYEDYNLKFRVLRDEIKSISNNGGQYSSSSIDKAIDGNISTHWETGTENSSDFKNEVVVEFKNLESINRIAYATRQDGAKGKGFPTQFETYSSITGNDDDFKLVSTGEHSSTGNMMEFKFDTITTKKIKFVFKEAHNEWASASEFWFYNEDQMLDKLNTLFTDSDMNEVSESFNDLDKLSKLEEEAKEHPFYEDFKEDIDNARTILESSEIESTKANVSKLTAYGTEYQDAYNERFMIETDKITKVEANGGIYPGTKYEYMFDGDPNTHWETNRSNSEDFINEITLTLDEAQTIDRLAYKARSINSKGFPTKFEIHVSQTSKGETFQKIATGEANVTSDMVEFKFVPTKAKRVRLVFNECHLNRAFASEMRLYKQDELSEKYYTLFTNDKKNELSSEFNSTEKLDKFAKELEKHPLYNLYKEGINDARLILENNNVTYVDARVSKFKSFGSPELVEYDKTYKIDNKRIVNITTNGGHYSNSVIEKAIDGDIGTSWNSSKTNDENHTNEVVMTLDKLETIDKVVYTSPRARGFAEAFDIYVSKTLEGETFQKVTSGKASRTNDSVSIKFNPTEARRVKFVYTKGYENFALAFEFGLYKQDSTIDKMDNLFTDETMNTVSEEFGTMEALNQLEDEVKKHLFYSDFKEDIENAKALLEQGQVEATVSKTKKFNHYNNQEYMDQYAINRENIKKISNNGGQYSTMKIDNAIDGDLDTYWETNTSNKENFKNEVTVEFINPVTIDRLVYGARQSDRKGFLQEFEIYVSATTKGDNFKLVSTAKADKTTGLVEAKFEPTKFQRLKIKVIKGDQNWATLNELIFFKEDIVADKVYNLFTNNLMNELNPEFNSLEAVEALEEEVKGHPISDDLMEIVDMAKDLLESPEKYQSNVFELESRGDSIAESQKRKVWNFQEWQPTGIAVKSGEKIEVYVDAEPSTPLPKLVFKQMDSQHNGQVIISLTNGKNVITIPEVNSNELRPGTSKAGVLYTSNPYTTEQQIRNPKIRIVGGISYPHFIKGVDSDEEVMEELREYNETLKADPSLPDVFDVFSDKTLVNVKATYALDWYTKNNKLPSSTADKSDEVIKETMKLWGFDGSSEVNSDFNFRYITMVKWLDNGGFMNAGNGITGFNRAEQGGALNVDTGWGFMHEMGHNFDTAGRTIVEVTNNILPLHFQRIKGERSKISEQNLWESRIFPKVSKEDYSNNEWYPDSDRSLLTHLSPLWQLQLYDDTFWPRFEQYFRANNIGGGSWENIHEVWAVAASDVLQLNLKEHFARHGFYVSEETAKHMEQYKTPTEKIWYLNDNKYLNEGEGFNEDVNCTVKPTVNENSIKLDIAIDKVNANSLLGYEIYRDGELIGFTDKGTYVDTEVDLGDNHIYEVVPFSNDLNTANKISVNSQQPVIETTGGVTVKLNEEFNPLDYVKSTDYQGNPIENIEVKHNVDNTKQGKYTVTYKVKDNNNLFADETLEVEVVSDYTFLSDIEWTSATSGYQNARRNESIKGRHLGDPKTFDKGLATHANGVIIYNLGEHDYDYLEMRVGVDMSIPEQNNSSITFKVTGDGKTLATTSVMKHADNLKYIKVPIRGVDEIKIEVNNGGNGITSDHGIIVEPKLATNNGKPTLKIDKSISVKVGEKLESVIGKVEAYDAEDGDLTKDVQIIG